MRATYMLYTVISFVHQLSITVIAIMYKGIIVIHLDVQSGFDLILWEIQFCKRIHSSILNMDEYGASLRNLLRGAQRMRSILQFFINNNCLLLRCILFEENFYRISPSISREISDNFENANLGVRPILGSRKMSSLTTRQATNMLTNFLNNKSLPLLLLCMCSRNS